MPEMQSFMGVNEGNGGIIGKLLYYSTSNILIPKNTFVQLGKAFNLPKVKPARESKSSAYRYATTALKERVATKDSSGTHIYRIYCRDNKQDTSAVICRELVKETMNATTNSYKKLANIAFKRETEEMYYDNLADDADVNAEDYCQQALTLFEKFRNCYNSDHVDSVVQYLLDKMQAVKIGWREPNQLRFVSPPFPACFALIFEIRRVFLQIRASQNEKRRQHKLFDLPFRRILIRTRSKNAAIPAYCKR